MEAGRFEKRRGGGVGKCSERRGEEVRRGEEKRLKAERFIIGEMSNKLVI